MWKSLDPPDVFTHHQSGQADAVADGISFDGEADETALKPNPNIPGVPNWEIEELRG